MKYESIALPTGNLPDGRKYITDTQCVENPEIAAFVARYPNYWERIMDWDIWVSPTVDITLAPRLSSKSYKCPVCGSDDPNLYLRCNRPDCTDGRDPR